MQIGILVLIFLPLFSYTTVKDINFLSKEKEERGHKTNLASIKSWTRKEVVKDLKFYSLLPFVLACPFVITGIVINQTFIIESKNWGEYAIAQAFMSYSALTVLTLFVSGFLVDKFTSRKILPYLNLPMLAGLIILIFFDHPYSAFLFMGLLGITNGLANILMSSFWAEIYGVNYLGSIKALTGSLMVFSTALATVTFGFLIESGYSIEDIAIVCSIYILISLSIVLIFRSLYKPILQKKT
jgi:MFS family permease